MMPIEKSSEKIVIGLALKGHQEALHSLVEKLRPEHFFGEGHQEIVTLIVTLNQECAPIDYCAVEDRITELKKSYLLNWLLECADRVFSWDEQPIEYHIKKILDAYRFRELLFACQQTVKEFSESTDYSEIYDRHLSRIGLLEAEHTQGTTFTSMEVCGQLKTQIQSSQVNFGGLVGLPTGFDKLNDQTGGFRPGELIVVAARPGVGKSVFATQVLLASPYEPSALVTLEMTSVEIMARMVSGRSGIPLNQIRQGDLAVRYDHDRVFGAIKALETAQIYFEDCPTVTITALRAKLRRLHSKHSIKIAVVDYLQLVSATPGNRVREIGEISRGLKSLAKELNIPIVALAQLNRGAADGDEPGLHHLRDSGEIEQDADIVILLHRPPPSEEQKKSHTFPTLIKIAKQRNGPVVGFYSTLHGATSKFIS